MSECLLQSVAMRPNTDLIITSSHGLQRSDLCFLCHKQHVTCYMLHITCYTPLQKLFQGPGGGWLFSFCHFRWACCSMRVWLVGNLQVIWINLPPPPLDTTTRPLSCGQPTDKGCVRSKDCGHSRMQDSKCTLPEPLPRVQSVLAVHFLSAKSSIYKQFWNLSPPPTLLVKFEGTET